MGGQNLSQVLQFSVGSAGEEQPECNTTTAPLTIRETPFSKKTTSMKNNRNHAERGLKVLANDFTDS